MNAYILVVAWILISVVDEALSDNHDLVKKYDGTSLTSEIVGLLNGTYFNLNEKVCLMQRRVELIEGFADSNDQCDCNHTEFKRSIANELKGFSKIISGFENELRILKNEQSVFRELLHGGNSDASTASTATAATTTVTPRNCDDGWISSPEKCYYVATQSEQTEWATAITRCIVKGANLVEIKSDEEARFIMSNLPYRVANSYFLYTGRKRNENNEWVFLSNNEPVDTSVRSWASGEPDGGSQTCGCARKADNFQMHDCVCTGFNNYYICEIVR